MTQKLLLHIGLHKTGTTYFQNAAWPEWKAVGYAGRPVPRGHASSEDAVFSMREPVVLMSNESSGGSLKKSYQKQHKWSELQLVKLEELKRRYAANYEIGVLIGLRSPESWVLSIYKHYLKFGGVETLEGFLGLDGRTPPTLEPEDLLFMPKLRRIKDVLGVEPFVFFLEELRLRPAELSSELARFAGVPEGPDFPQGRTFNEGVNTCEAEICRKINRSLINRGCLGKGWIKRNKTIAFRIARKLAGNGNGRGDKAQQLKVSSEATSYIREHTSEDLKAVCRMLDARRELSPGNSAEALGFNWL